jgi:hypothetical protein
LVIRRSLAVSAASEERSLVIRRSLAVSAASEERSLVIRRSLAVSAASEERSLVIRRSLAVSAASEERSQTNEPEWMASSVRISGLEHLHSASVRCRQFPVPTRTTSEGT